MQKAVFALLAGVALTAAGATLTASGLYLGLSIPDFCRLVPCGTLVDYSRTPGEYYLNALRERSRTLAISEFEFLAGVSVLSIGVVSLMLASFRLLKRAH